MFTAWKVSKYGVFSGPYFPVFGLNTGIYGPEKTSYLDTFYPVVISGIKCIEKVISNDDIDKMRKISNKRKSTDKLF